MLDGHGHQAVAPDALARREKAQDRPVLLGVDVSQTKPAIGMIFRPKRKNATTADAPTSPRTETTEKDAPTEEKMSERALCKKVIELGVQPLYEDLLPKLEAFTSDDDFKRNVAHWNLVELDLPQGPYAYAYYFRKEDFAHVTATDMYRNFVMTDGGCFFEEFLRRKHGDIFSWQCMKSFEAMKTATKYEELMGHFHAVASRLPLTDFGRNNPDECAILQECVASFVDNPGPLSAKEKQHITEAWKETLLQCEEEAVQRRREKETQLEKVRVAE